MERQYLQPSVEERKRAVKDLLRLNLHIGTWEEVKEDLLRIRASDVETP